MDSKISYQPINWHTSTEDDFIALGNLSYGTRTIIKMNDYVLCCLIIAQAQAVMDIISGSWRLSDFKCWLT